MSSIIKELEGNSIVDLRLSDADDEALDESDKIAAALKKNSSVKTIRAEGYLACLRNDARVEFLEAMGKASSLEEVYIVESLMTVTCLTKLVSNAKILKILSLNDIVLQGVQDHFDECEKAMSEHIALKEFRMEEVKPAVADVKMNGFVKIAETKTG